MNIITAQKHHQTTIVASFISSVIQFDKFFHPVVLDEIIFICIFMNINENLKNEGVKTMGKTIVCNRVIRPNLNT